MRSNAGVLSISVGDARNSFKQVWMKFLEMNVNRCDQSVLASESASSSLDHFNVAVDTFSKITPDV